MAMAEHCAIVGQIFDFGLQPGYFHWVSRTYCEGDGYEVSGKSEECCLGRFWLPKAEACIQNGSTI